MTATKSTALEAIEMIKDAMGEQCFPRHEFPAYFVLRSVPRLPGLPVELESKSQTIEGRILREMVQIFEDHKMRWGIAVSKNRTPIVYFYPRETIWNC